MPFLAGCGAVTNVSPDVTPAPATVTPSACSIVSSAAVATALALPSQAEMPPGSPTPSTKTVAEPAPPGAYNVTSVAAYSNVGQCTYNSGLGTQMIVSVFPHTTLTALPDFTAGLRPMGSTLVSSTDSSGLIAFQDSGAVIGVSLQVGAINQSALARRMGTVVESVTGQQLPLPALSFTASSAAAGAPTLPPAAGAPVTGATATATVQQTNALAFDPASTTVGAGGVVEWTNASSVAHNVTFDADPELTSQTMSPGQTYEIKFTQPGQYPYHCTFHPGMNGTITVS